MKKKKSNVNNITIISIIIVLLVLCLSIGWSSFNSSMRVDSVAMVRIKSDIRVTGFNSTTGNNGGTSSNDEYNVNYVTGTVNLPNSNSTVTYKVEITNMELATNTFMGIYSLTGLPSNLEIKSITGYTIKDKICDDNNTSDCVSGAQKTFYITVGYKDNTYDANNTSFGFKIDVNFKNVYDIHYSGFTSPPSSPVTVMDGETPTIIFNNDASNSLNITSGGVTLTAGTNYSYSNRVLTFLTPIRDHLYINNLTQYTITYVLNGGTQANNQVTTYSPGENRAILSPTKSGNIFGGWYLYNDFSGDDIRNTNVLSGDVTLYANWVTQKARIGSTYYDTLQLAIDAVPTDGTETIVELLDNTSEVITIAAGKNVVFDLKNNTLRNNGNSPVITNNGSLKITNGTIASSATQGAINNNSTLVMTGGRIEATGTRQAIYNAGTVTISGDAYLSNVSVERAVVQNLAGGTVNITGGTIVASHFSAVVNNGTLNIGTKDGNVSITTPVIRGDTYGIEATTRFNFYDGKIQGKTAAFNNESLINDIETNYELLHKSETVSGAYYKTVYLGQAPYNVIFDPGNGTVDEPVRQIEAGNVIGPLPTPTQSGYIFDGWYDDDHDGHEVGPNEYINSNITFYAHWIDENDIRVARIGSDEYATLPEAFNAITNSNPTTIVILTDINLEAKESIASSRNITIDLNGHNINYSGGTVFENLGTFAISDSAGGGSITGGKRNGNSYIPAILNKKNATISLSSGSIYSDVSQVFENNGTFYMTGGSISIGDIPQGILNNNAGATLHMSGGTISATIEGSKRQAIYNKGTANISGTAVLISATTDRAVVQNDNSGAVINISGGSITSTSTICERGAVQNINNATVNITGGTIISHSTDNNSGAVQNAGTLVIGTKDGVISASTPDLRGETYGVNNSKTFKFYDGVIKGKTDSINGSVTDFEGSRVDTTEVIGGTTYHKTYLN